MAQDGWLAKPGVQVVFGKWQDVDLAALGPFHGVFFDTCVWGAFAALQERRGRRRWMWGDGGLRKTNTHTHARTHC
jgi:hypothetical protein